MRAKNKGTKMPKAPQRQAKKPRVSESFDLSSIERASILDGEPHGSYGNPLHSTALEDDDFRLPEEEEEEEEEEAGEKGGGGGLGKAALAAVTKQRPAASPRKKEEARAGGKRGKKRKSVGENEAAGRGGKAGGITEEKRRKGPGSGKRPAPLPTNRRLRLPQAPAPSETTLRVTPPDTETAGRRVRRQLQLQFVARPGKDKEAEKENEKGRKLANRKSSSSQTPSPGPKRARTRKSSSSRSADRQPKLARKSSSSVAGAVHPVTQKDSPRGRPRGHGGADSSVVLDTFLSLCQTYKESVESTAVRHAIDTFSSTLKEQLTERITTSKEIRVLKRDNAKVDSLINRKTRKLLDAKYELVRAEQQLGLLRKEKVELSERLAHLRRGLSFLHGIRDLTTRYLAHRHAHPTEKEQYGSSSLPALLLETKTILRAEDHLRKINNQLEARMRKNKPM